MFNRSTEKTGYGKVSNVKQTDKETEHIREVIRNIEDLCRGFNIHLTQILERDPKK